MALSQLFWDVLMPWNLKSTYFSLKIIHFLSLNIWYVIYVVFWIKYWNLKLPHHCILFLFTICTVSQLFWNRVCIYTVYIYIFIYYICMYVCIYAGGKCACNATKNIKLYILLLFLWWNMAVGMFWFSIFILTADDLLLCSSQVRIGSVTTSSWWSVTSRSAASGCAGVTWRPSSAWWVTGSGR